MSPIFDRVYVLTDDVSGAHVRYFAIADPKDTLSLRTVSTYTHVSPKQLSAIDNVCRQSNGKQPEDVLAAIGRVLE